MESALKFSCKVWVFWEGHTIWNKSSSYFWQEGCVLCAQQRTCHKVDEDFLKQMWSSRIIQLYFLFDFDQPCVVFFLTRTYYGCFRINVRLQVKRKVVDLWLVRHPVESSIMTVNSPQMKKNSFGDFSSFLPDYLELEVLYHYQSKYDF